MRRATSRSTGRRSTAGAGVAVIVTLVVLAGCGSGSGAKASATTTGHTVPPAVKVDPCHLLTPAEVEAAIGGIVTAPASKGLDCRFTNGSRAILLSTASGQAQFDADQELAHGTTVDGIGDHAFADPDRSVVELIKDGAVVQLHTAPAHSGEADTTMLERLAREVAARL